MTKIYTLTHILVLIFFSISICFSQTSEPEWEEKYGTFFDDAANDIILNNEGGLTMIGETNPPGASGKDILFISLDKLHYVNYEKPIVLSGTDGANALVQTRDGGYAIAGHTTSKEVEQYHGKKDGLILKVTEKGRPLWYLAVGSKEDDELFDIIEDRDGNLVVSGHKNGACFVAKISAQGELVWQKIFPFSVGRSYANTLLQNLEGQYVLAGHVEEDKYTQTAFVMGLDDTPTRKWKEEYANGSIKQIIENKDGTLIFTGTTYEKETREDILLMKTYRTGGQIWRKNYGGSGYDGALGLTQDFDGNYFLGGYNSSFERGAKRDLAWVVKVNQDGQRMSDMDLLFGKNSQDEFRALVTDYDGSIIAAGASASGKKLLFDAWALKVPTDERVLPSGKVILRSSKATFYDENEDGVLNPNERGYVAFTLTNTSDIGVEKIVISTGHLKEKTSGFYYNKELRIARIAPNEEYQVFLPVFGGSKLKNGKTDFEIKFASERQELASEKINFSVECIKEAEPKFAISTATFSINDAPIETGRNGEDITVNYVVQNIGNRSAKNVKIRLNTELYITPVSNKIITLSELKVGEEKQIKFTFKAEEVYRGDRIVIKSHISEKGYDFEKKRDFTLFLEDKVPVKNDYAILTWISPSPTTKEGEKYIASKAEYDIEIRAISNLKLEEEDFTIYLDDNPLSKGSKFDEVKLSSVLDNQDGVGKRQEFTFSGKLFLTPGEHRIKASIRKNDLIENSSSLTISYSINKPNLHILAIGVPGQNLLYPSNDARDFVDMYKAQTGAGMIYNEAFVTLLNKRENTTKKEIERAFLKLISKAKNGEIRDNDRIIIYISSHGYKSDYEEENGFYLQPSDYVISDYINGAIDYQYEIIKRLNNIEAKKILFIDACNSGTIAYGGKSSELGADVEVSDAIIKINKDAKNVRALVSCRAEEKSYEHKEWENGAFTEALVEAFKNVEAPTLLGKINANIIDEKDRERDTKYLTVRELCKYLEARVPFLVREEFPEEPGQNPYIETHYLDDDFPIYFYNKK